MGSEEQEQQLVVDAGAKQGDPDEQPETEVYEYVGDRFTELEDEASDESATGDNPESDEDPDELDEQRS
jgi:hypothetical protein